jgi:hypothetical protein
MILRRTEPHDPLCERCLKLQKIKLAVVAFELADDEQTLADTGRLLDPTSKIVEEDGGARSGL